MLVLLVVVILLHMQGMCMLCVQNITDSWLTLLCCVLLCSLIILALPSLEDANVKVVEFSCERRFLITEKCK